MSQVGSNRNLKRHEVYPPLTSCHRILCKTRQLSSYLYWYFATTFYKLLLALLLYGERASYFVWFRNHALLLCYDLYKSLIVIVASFASIYFCYLLLSLLSTLTSVSTPTTCEWWCQWKIMTSSSSNSYFSFLPNYSPDFLWFIRWEMPRIFFWSIPTFLRCLLLVRKG